MKILYIYRDYKGRRKKYGEMMNRCGHEVVYELILEKKIPNQITPKDIKKHNPDVLWLYTTYYLWKKVISQEAIDYCRKEGIRIVSYSHLLQDLTLEKQIGIYKNLDILFMSSKEGSKYFENNGINSFYVPLGFYPDQYFKTKSSKKEYDVSFMGSAFKNLPTNKDRRNIFLQSLKDHNIAVFGEGFKERLKGINIPIGKYRGHDIQREVYSKTKINLGLPFSLSSLDEYRGKCYLKNRFFEIPATRNFFLTIRDPDFLEIFDEDTIGYYDNSIESMKENIDRYLVDKDIREKMAAKAYKMVHEKHTYFHRFQDMFKIIKK